MRKGHDNEKPPIRRILMRAGWRDLVPDDENDSHKIGSGGKLVKGVDGDGKMSLDEGNSR
jgi:hypothetical protein